MTLEERIATIPHGEFIYVGSASGYVFIGPAAESISKLERMSTQYYKRFEYNLNFCEHKLEYKKERIDFWGKQIGAICQHIDKCRVQVKLYETTLTEISDEDIQEKQELELEIKYFNKKISEESRRVEDIKLTVAGLKKDTKNTELRIPELRQILNTWKDFLKREIINEYPHDCIAPLGTTLIIEGTEIGDFWMYSEVEEKEFYEKGRKYG